MEFNQFHSGSGDNIAGNKIVINKLPDRSIANIKEELVKEIKMCPQNYKIYLSNGDPEIESLAKEIDYAFKEAGWNATGFIYNLAGSYAPGITFGVQAVDEVSQYVANLFSANGFKVTGSKYDDIDQFHIIIGPNK